jgi:hypothetical protein
MDLGLFNLFWKYFAPPSTLEGIIMWGISFLIPGPFDDFLSFTAPFTRDFIPECQPNEEDDPQ